MNLQQLVDDAPNVRIETERLVLRPMTEADLRTAIAHEQDRTIMQWIRDPAPLAETEARCRSALEPWDGADGRWRLLAIEARPEAGVDLQEMLGIVCFRVTVRDYETMEFGYRLTPRVHRRGFGYEACSALLEYLFETGEVRRVVALCVTENDASWRLMEKLGMRREGVFQEYSMLAGEWRDELSYGMLRREWLAARGQ